MESLYGYIRNLAKVAADSKYKPVSVKVYFSAPEKASSEEIAKGPEGDAGSNFQWTRYEMTFSREMTDESGHPMKKHYVYKTPLASWGSEAPGGQEVMDSDPNITESDMTPDEVKKALPKYLKGPYLYPVGVHGFYINTHKTAPGGKEYPYSEFDKKFRKSGFYKVIGKDHNPRDP